MPAVKTTPSYQEELRELAGQLGQALPEKQFAIFNNDAKQLAQRYTQPLKLKEGDQAIDFSLTNAKNETIKLSDLLAKGPFVLTFYRGAWCPYCNLQLRQYQQILPQIKEQGGNLIAVSPQTPDSSLDMAEKNSLQFEVLSDPGNAVARKYTTVFKNGDAPLQAMADLGYDFDRFYSDDTRELPVPATFVITREGIIAYAFTGGGDYRLRAEPRDLLKALKA